MLVLVFVPLGCGGDPFSAEGGEGDAGSSGPSGPNPAGPSTPGSGLGLELDVAPGTPLSDLTAAQRATLCDDVLKVFDADVDNERYLEIYCTDLAWDGDTASCDDSYEACLEQLPKPVLSAQVSDALGCDFNVALDAPCVTVKQTLDCWRAFGVAYEEGFLDSSVTPRDCAEAAVTPPQLSAQVDFSIPASCSLLTGLTSGCTEP